MTQSFITQAGFGVYKRNSNDISRSVNNMFYIEDFIWTKVLSLSDILLVQQMAIILTKLVRSNRLPPNRIPWNYCRKNIRDIKITWLTKKSSYDV